MSIVATQPLECELLSLLGGDEKARVVARYCGFDGLGGTTLQIVGAEFGITAERVRQIVGEVVKRCGSESPAAPALLEAISFIARHTPGVAEEIEAKLQSAGLSSRPFRVEGVIRAAELLGQSAPFKVTETQRARLVHSLSPGTLDAIVRVARRAIEQWGVASLATVLEDVGRVAPEAADRRLIADVLTSAGDLRWLDQPLEWFWLPGVSRNPLVRRIRKVLAVVNPVRFTELCAAVTRDRRSHDDSPPPAVLLELCRQLPGVRVAGESVEADPGAHPHEALGELEKAIVDVLAEHGGVMRRTVLAGICRKRGVNRSSFYSALTHSPVFVSYPAGVLGLVGSPVAPGPPPDPAAKQRSKYLHSKARAHTIRLRKWLQ